MMTNLQLYLAIGIPVISNAAMVGLLMIYINSKFSDAREVWRAELRRVEEVLDARLKHLEAR